MRILRIFLVAIGVSALVGFSSSAMAQEVDEIETDRDAFTRSPRIVAPGRFVMEGSYTFLEQDAEYDGHLYPDLLVRYGLNERLELRLGWNYEVNKYSQLKHVEAEEEKEGLMIYGAKFFLTEADCWMPDSSVILSGYTPTSGESNDTDFSIEYAAGWEWENGLELETGLRWYSLAEQEDHFTEWAPSIVLKSPIFTERVTGHVEYFTELSTGREDNYTMHYV
ncbi:MAG: transporter [Pirellulales bacterium]|jgi:hypothetical protein